MTYKIKAHIIAVQETHFRLLLSSLILDFPIAIQANGTAKNAGVAILFANQCQFLLSSWYANSEGRYLILVGN